MYSRKYIGGKIKFDKNLKKNNRLRNVANKLNQCIVKNVKKYTKK